MTQRRTLILLAVLICCIPVARAQSPMSPSEQPTTEPQTDYRSHVFVFVLSMFIGPGALQRFAYSIPTGRDGTPQLFFSARTSNVFSPRELHP